MISALLLLFSVAGTDARAELIPALKPGLEPREIRIYDEKDEERSLAEVATSKPAMPILLLPAYTRCRASCPIMVKSLKMAVAAMPSGEAFRVILFSFDSKDTRSDLARFRQHEQIPNDWQLVRSTSESEIAGFLDPFGYNTLSANGEFNHPSEVFVFSPRFKWVDSLISDVYLPESLQLAHAHAFSADEPSLKDQARELSRRPENWLILGAIGLVLSIGAIATAFIRG
ncbi:MAG: SCO family protein [Oligoflexia bacterium]|nr:SCO family protein [Oligoflexia bacterium]